MVGGEHQHGVRAFGKAAIFAETVVELLEVARRHVVIAIVVGLRYLRLARRRERREHMSDRVRALEVDDRQIRTIAREDLASQFVVDLGVDQDPSQGADRLRIRIVGVRRSRVLVVCQPRQVGLQRGLADGLLCMRERVARPAFPVGRRDHAGRRRFFLEEEREQPVGDDRAVDLLRRIGGPQPERGDALAGRGRHVPDRRRAAHAAGDRLLRAGLRIELHEVEDAVIERADAGHHRGPDQRRERRTDGLEDAAGAFTNELREVGHRAGRDVVVEELPVGAVEPDEDDRPSSGSCCGWPLGSRCRV